MRHARGRKLESGVQKNRSIKPKIRWKAKGLPDVWQGQHQVLEVQQALISLTQEIIKREYRNVYKPWKLLMFPGFFTSPETLWNVVKRGEKESKEYSIQAGRRPWRTIAAGNSP